MCSFQKWMAYGGEKMRSSVSVAVVVVPCPSFYGFSKGKSMVAENHGT